MNREEFLKGRRTGIGGSDVAAILGLSKYRTALQVYQEKVGDLVSDDSDKMDQRRRAGQVFQRAIIETYCEDTGSEIVAYEPELVRHPEYPFLIANLDAVVKNAEGDEWNVDAKNVHWKLVRDWGEEGSDRLPDDAFYQGHHYDFVTGRFKTDFAVLMGGEFPPRQYTVAADRDEAGNVHHELYELLLDDLIRFWHHVKTQNPPPPDFAHKTTVELMKRMYPEVDVRKEITISAPCAELAERYWLLGQIEKAAGDRRDAIKAELLFALGDAAVAKIEGSPIVLKRTPIPGGAVVSFVKKSSVRFDAKFPKHHVHEFSIADAPQLLGATQLEVVNG